MIIVIVTSIMIGAFAGIAIMACLGVSHNEPKEPGPEQTKLLTVGCLVKYEGRIWEIRKFRVDSQHRTIAEIENCDDENHVIRRTMAAVEELEEVME